MISPEQMKRLSIECALLRRVLQELSHLSDTDYRDIRSQLIPVLDDLEKKNSSQTSQKVVGAKAFRGYPSIPFRQM